MTPGSWRNVASTPQKHPAANVAFAISRSKVVYQLDVLARGEVAGARTTNGCSFVHPLLCDENTLSQEGQTGAPGNCSVSQSDGIAPVRSAMRLTRCSIHHCSSSSTIFSVAHGSQ